MSVIAAPQGGKSSASADLRVRADTFSPQMNSNMKRLSRNYYDDPRSSPGGNKSVWEHILKADHVKQAAFESIDVNSALCRLTVAPLCQP